MHYVLTGGAGHITLPLAKALLANNHAVTIIGRSAAKLQPLVDIGATAAVGSVEDQAFLINTFAGADAVYLMIPPKWEVEHWLEYQKMVADNYLKAIQANQISRAVMLSSIGAHLRHGAGPIDGLGYLETILDADSSIYAIYLRPSYFYYNLLGMVPLLKNMGILGSNFGGGNEPLVLVDTNDIAEAAAVAIQDNTYEGKTVRYISSSAHSTLEIAEVLSKAAGKPAPWVVFTDEQAMQGMLQNGLPPTIAEGYLQLGKSLREGILQEDYWKHTPVQGKVTLEDFAKIFAHVYQTS